MTQAHDGESHQACPDDPVLEEYALHRLAGDEWKRLETHVQGCENCTDRSRQMAADARIITALLRSPGPEPAGECLDLETLAFYVDGTLDEEERSEATAHLATCPACSQTLVNLYRELKEVDSGQSPVGDSTGQTEPAGEIHRLAQGDLSSAAASDLPIETGVQAPSMIPIWAVLFLITFAFFSLIASRNTFGSFLFIPAAMAVTWITCHFSLRVLPGVHGEARSSLGWEDLLLPMVLFLYVLSWTSATESAFPWLAVSGSLGWCLIKLSRVAARFRASKDATAFSASPVSHVVSTSDETPKRAEGSSKR